MKKALLFLLCALMVLSLAACGEKEVSNDDIDFSDNSGFSDSTFDEGDFGEGDVDEELMNIQDIIGFWCATSIYQVPRATDNEYASDEEALLYAQGMPVQISANEFDSPLFYTDNAVFKKVSADLGSLSNYGIQVDDTLRQLVGEGEIVRVDIYDGDSADPSFQVFIINGSTMLYEGDSGYILLAELEESVG